MLSANAQVLARFNADGITVGEVSLASLNLPSPSAPDYMELAMQATARLGPPTNSKGQDDGAISQSSFEAVIKQFGGKKAQADQLFAALDTDGSGSISNSELLTGMSNTGSDPASSSSQALLKLMDTDGGGTVNTVEFSSFEGAMVAAEKAPAQ
ncbi:EF-hand domain-containing protein [Caballeronia sp.]|uniref:EF-hand domain-containing protein n=1 Tax=Caballeronia sp. TaxID=1931223 RepID=UPI003C570C63